MKKLLLVSLLGLVTAPAFAEQVYKCGNGQILRFDDMAVVQYGEICPDGSWAQRQY